MYIEMSKNMNKGELKHYVMSKKCLREIVEQNKRYANLANKSLRGARANVNQEYNKHETVRGMNYAFAVFQFERKHGMNDKSGDLLKEFIQSLGPIYHAKDIVELANMMFPTDL